MSLAVHDAKGEKTKRTVDLPEALFDVQVNVPLIHQVVMGQLAAARQGTHASRGRGAVRGGGRKPHRQKGTGRARQGSVRAPHYTGGGTVHGPVPRGYGQRTPKRMKAASLAGALSDRARGERVHVVSALVTGDTPSTKAAAKVLASLTEGRQALVVVDRDDTVTALSVRNLTDVSVLPQDQLNTYDVLVADDVVFTESALRAFCAGPVGTRLGAGELSTSGDAEEPAEKKTAAKKADAEQTADDGEGDDE